MPTDPVAPDWSVCASGELPGTCSRPLLRRAADHEIRATMPLEEVMTVLRLTGVSPDTAGPGVPPSPPGA